MVHRSAVHRPTLLLTLLVMIAVAGCDTTGSTSPTAPETPSRVTAAPTGPASGEVPGSPSADAPRIIPASAFFEMPAGMRREHGDAEGSAAVPDLCNGELAASDDVVASAAVMNLYQRPDAQAGAVPHGVLYQTIRSYDGDGAAKFMKRARSGLADCESYRNGEHVIDVRTKPLSAVADEGLTIDLTRPQLDLPGNPTGGEQTNRLVVMRFGPVVTVLYDSEYERSSSIPELVGTFTREAADAIRAWRG